MLKVRNNKFANRPRVGETIRQYTNPRIINDLLKIGGYMRKVGEVVTT